MLSVREFFMQAPRIEELLEGHDFYWAHLPLDIDRPNKKEEALYEHVHLVNDYVIKLVDAHGLEGVIDSLICEITKGLSPDFDQSAMQDAIKRRFVYAFVFHDFGKINHNFQVDRMKNTANFERDESSLFYPPHGHSELSAFLYNVFFQENSPIDQSRDFLIVITLFFSYSIFNHHGKALFDMAEGLERKAGWHDVWQKLGDYSEQLGWKLHEKPMFVHAIKHIHKALSKFHRCLTIDTFAVFALIKLNYSLLTAADYLATCEYMNDMPTDDFGTINKNLRDGILKNIKNNKEITYNQKILSDVLNPNFEYKCPKAPNNDNLNRLRHEMAVEALRNIRINRDKSIFYLEAPTGGGKTNISMLAAATLLELKPKLNKIIYVFPFTTLVTQTHKAIIKTYGLNETQVAQIHSKTPYKEPPKGDIGTDGEYGQEKRNYIQNLFHHYPISLVTHIRFFDWLKTSFKETNYAMHRLANSIVIIDELQSYNPKHWDKIIYFIENYARHFNIKFILMSATLPKLGELLRNVSNSAPDIVHLLPEVKSRYFQNPNFKDRVSFDFSLLNQKIDIAKLASVVLDKSKEYAQSNAQYPNSVHVIVEFIFKRSASVFYEEVNGLNQGFFDEMLVLSGTILEHRRREVINMLKGKKFRSKRVLLITTQVVEAGVDIDMDIGFKDSSLIDSDEQLAGRINRNVGKSGCTLFLFRMDRASILYKHDYRYQQVSERKIRMEDYQRILKEKDFDYLYKLVFLSINELNADDGIIESLCIYKKYVKALDFISMHNKFKLIQQDNVSIFVPTNIPVCIKDEGGGLEQVLSEQELSFLEENGIFEKAGKINGEKVFNLYLLLVQNKEGDFIARMTNYKRLQAIMSRFVFSIFAKGELLQNLKAYARNEYSEPGEDYNEYGYMYLIGHEKIYSIEQGLVEEKLGDTDNQII